MRVYSNMNWFPLSFWQWKQTLLNFICAVTCAATWKLLDFLHSMNWSYFSLHSVIELMKSELLYVSFQRQGFVFTCQLYETVAGNNQVGISFRWRALGLFSRHRRITLATQHYVTAQKNASFWYCQLILLKLPVCVSWLRAILGSCHLKSLDYIKFSLT